MNHERHKIDGLAPVPSCKECLALIESPASLWAKYLRTCKAGSPWSRLNLVFDDD